MDALHSSTGGDTRGGPSSHHVRSLLRHLGQLSPAISRLCCKLILREQWENKACPVNGTDRSLIPHFLMGANNLFSPLVLYEALEVCTILSLLSRSVKAHSFSQGILNACLTNGHLSLEKFSRWLRSICIILLSQGTVADRLKAIQYMEQASAVLEEHGNLVENGNPVSCPYPDRGGIL